MANLHNGLERENVSYISYKILLSHYALFVLAMGTVRFWFGSVETKPFIYNNNQTKPFTENLKPN